VADGGALRALPCLLQEQRAASAKAAIARLYGEGASYETLIRESGFDVASLVVWYTPAEDRSLGSWVRVGEFSLAGE
jgi:hypothetical protein